MDKSQVLTDRTEIKSTRFFISNARVKVGKNQADVKQHPEADLLLFENYSRSSFTLPSKNNRTYSKKISKRTSASVFIRLIIMKMKNRLHRYDINRPRSRHGHKYSKYKKCLSMAIRICIKQHLSNTWSSIHEKVKQHWGWVEKKHRLYNKACTYTLVIST